jgi:predicted ATPase
MRIATWLRQLGLETFEPALRDKPINVEGPRQALDLDPADAEPEVLARHCAGAGLIEDAVAFWLRAAVQACERLATAEAISHLCRGLELLDGLPPVPPYRFERLGLLAALGRTLRRERGCAAPEVGQAFELALALCREMDETPALFPIAHELCDHHLTRADHGSARGLALQCARLAAGGAEPGRLAEAHLCQGVSALFTGEIALAQEHLTKSAALHAVPADRQAARPLAGSPRAVPLTHLAQTLWLRGFPDQARRAGEEAVAAARADGAPFALAYALLGASWLHRLLRQPATTRTLAAEAIGCAGEGDLPAFHAMAALLHAWATPEPSCSADPAPAATMHAALTRYRATGAELGRPFLLGLLVDAQERARDPEHGLWALSEALETSRSTGERWYEPELCRQEGEILLERSIANRKMAAACFCQALTLARQQGSRSLELRAAVSLARLWADLHRRSEARAMLEPVYGWFTEGFETADLKDARALLDELR